MSAREGQAGDEGAYYEAAGKSLELILKVLALNAKTKAYTIHAPARSHDRLVVSILVDRLMTVIPPSSRNLGAKYIEV